MIERLIDIENYRLYIRELGDGGPTVICENGLGETLESWYRIQTSIAKKVKVICYDRAGCGKSEKSGKPKTSVDMAKDLKILLEKADIKPPYILVGASYGGFAIRTYASLFPDEVDGMILVEATHEDYFNEIKKNRTTNEFNAYMLMLNNLSSLYKDDSRLEWEYIEKNCELARGQNFSNSIPTIILTSSRYSDLEKYLMDLRKEDIEVRCELHKRWFQTGEIMKHYITENSGHNIIKEEPDLVISAINEILSLK